jgi:hypothetical protein
MLERKQRRLEFDSQLVEESSKLLQSATKVARACFSDEEIVEQVNRALQEAATDDDTEQVAWEAGVPQDLF